MMTALEAIGDEGAGGEMKEMTVSRDNRYFEIDCSSTA
jgi:hypothetical protein